jgi:hypothetical protein
LRTLWCLELFEINRIGHQQDGQPWQPDQWFLHEVTVSEFLYLAIATAVTLGKKKLAQTPDFIALDQSDGLFLPLSAGMACIHTAVSRWR